MNIQPLLEKSSVTIPTYARARSLACAWGCVDSRRWAYLPIRAANVCWSSPKTDGCFADGLTAATDCAVGHRTLRVEDYGKAAATFVDTSTGLLVRVAPVLDIRERAYQCAPNESRHYFAQMQAYQIMPDEEMFTVTEVHLAVSIAEIVSRPGVRVNLRGVWRGDHERA
ncbi:MAG: FmdE family protein [Chromatiales bacterium]|nr:FmdE family protein [Chromatiales bacterium]